MKDKKVLYIIISVVLLVIIFYALKGIVSIYKSNKMNPFEYIKSKGAELSKTAGVGNRYDFGDYGFYSNNRAVQFSTGKKGTYNKVIILFDDGTSVTLDSIFK